MNRLPYIAVLFAAVLLVAADKKSKKHASSAAQIQLWVKQLGDESFKVREEATRDLIKAGGIAFAAVSQATKSKDLEVKQRALRIIKQFEKEAKVLLRQGVAWWKKRDFDKAITAYTEAIRLNPKFAEAYFNRGIYWTNKSEFDKAFSDFKEVIRLNPESAEAYVSRGVAWFNKGEYDEAIVEYNEAIRLNPKFAEAYVRRGKAWAKKGDITKAIPDLIKANDLRGISPNPPTRPVRYSGQLP